MYHNQDRYVYYRSYRSHRHHSYNYHCHLNKYHCHYPPPRLLLPQQLPTAPTLNHHNHHHHHHHHRHCSYVMLQRSNPEQSPIISRCAQDQFNFDCVRLTANRILASPQRLHLAWNFFCSSYKIKYQARMVFWSVKIRPQQSWRTRRLGVVIFSDRFFKKHPFLCFWLNWTVVVAQRWSKRLETERSWVSITSDVGLSFTLFPSPSRLSIKKSFVEAQHCWFNCQAWVKANLMSIELEKDDHGLKL